jgi:hypothetical protein
MLLCQCPNCKSTFECSSSDFGQPKRCPHCGYDFTLETRNLVHYEIPNTIEIQLLDEIGKPFTEFPVPIMVDYGYYIPPPRSERTTGRAIITHELILEAQRGHFSAGIMDAKYDDYTLNRYLIIRILNQKQASQKAKARLTSGWPITDLEKRLYRDMDNLIMNFIPLRDIMPVEKFIDLGQKNEAVKLDITIIRLSNTEKTLYCPKCGDKLKTTSHGPYCQRGDMYLSQLLERRFVACFILEVTNPREFQLNFRVGGNWFCPKCGIQAQENNGFVRCPKCKANLNEFMYPLVELHPHLKW